MLISQRHRLGKVSRRPIEMAAPGYARNRAFPVLPNGLPDLDTWVLASFFIVRVALTTPCGIHRQPETPKIGETLRAKSTREHAKLAEFLKITPFKWLEAMVF